MDQITKTRWLEELRSGRYKQTDGYLHVSDERAARRDIRPGFCCLGVLACVMGRDPSGLGPAENLDDIGLNVLGPWNSESDPGDYDSGEPDTHTTLQRKLAAMNDTGKTFPEIADWVEANVPVDEAA